MYSEPRRTTDGFKPFFGVSFERTTTLDARGRSCDCFFGALAAQRKDGGSAGVAAG